MGLLLTISVKTDIFNQEQRSMASRWYNSIEGSRSRKARVNTGSLAESAIASSRRGVSDYGSAYDEELDPLLLAELEGADDEFDEEGKRKRKPRKNASKL